MRHTICGLVQERNKGKKTGRNMMDGTRIVSSVPCSKVVLVKFRPPSFLEWFIPD